MVVSVIGLEGGLRHWVFGIDVRDYKDVGIVSVTAK
jgi:hypothetical protein